MRRLALALTLLLLPVIALAAPITYLADMSIQPSSQATRITFTLTKKTFGKVKYLPKAKQLIVEFANTKSHMTLHNARLGGANVVSMSSDALSNNTLHLTFTVRDKVRWHISYLPTHNNQNIQLQLDIISINNKKAKPTVAPLPAPTPMTAPVIPAPMPQAAPPNQHESERTFTVVIDAGHGGSDSGAIGPHGVMEKNVVLAIARKLADDINQTKGMHAELTRDGDYFVSLRNRLKLARKGKADIFIAIHADAYLGNNARGASVYALSRRGATSEAARWLAQKDNYSELDDLELNSLHDRSALLRSVLIDMAQTATIQDSISLGQRVLHAIDEVSPLHYKKVEQAPFVVLKSPDIPSILIETGFISNPSEERQLSNPRYQDEMARAIFQGIMLESSKR